jgi:DNA-directed RNA polymerase specialized sigma subunit
MEKPKGVRGKLLDVAQIAEYLNVSKQTVHKIFGQRKVSWYPLTEGKFQADSADIDDWLASIKVPAGKSLVDHLNDLDAEAEAKLLKAIKNLSKRGKLDFLLKNKEAV